MLNTYRRSDSKKARYSMGIAFSVLASIAAPLLIPSTSEAQAEPTTTWRCLRYGKNVGVVSIWWGHSEEDAAWACNQWVSKCKGSCSATYLSASFELGEEADEVAEGQSAD